jgi:hypothetical protein
MTAFPSSRRRSRLPIVIALLLIIVAATAGGTYYLWPRFESEPPQITVAPTVDVLGAAPLEIQVSDKGTGLRSFKATLTQGGTEIGVASEQFDPPVRGKKVAVAPAKMSGVKEGPVVLRITARDASLSHFFKGNETSLERSVTIDVTPPTLELIADDRYINFGGVGAIVYKPSADALTSGVRIGAYFFPGFPGQVKGHPDHFIALFAHPYNVPPSTKAVLTATDKAGNTRDVPLVYELKDVKYKKSTIALSDSFLQTKVAPLLNDVAARQGTPKEIFVAVNNRLRKENEDKIAAITKKPTPSLLWSGAFTQLSNSKVEANFADQRT